MKTPTLFAAFFCILAFALGGWAAQAQFLNGDCPDRDAACIDATAHIFAVRCDLALFALAAFILCAFFAVRKPKKG